MPRLISLEPDREQRGVVAIVVALMLVFLLGLSALAVDGGQMWADKARTQSAADTAAVAIAAACAAGDCGNPDQTAALYADGNGAQNATATVDGTQVTVTATTHNTYLFGAFVGNPEGTVISTATASWAQLTSATTLPYAVTQCAWNNRTSDDQVLKLNGDSSCPSGAFTYLRTTDTCLINSGAGNTVPATAGSTCSLDGLNDTTVLLPVLRGPASGGNREVLGIAAFRLTGWCATTGSFNSAGWCSVDNQQLRGHFVDYVALQAGQTSTEAPNFGVLGVRLT